MQLSARSRDIAAFAAVPEPQQTLGCLLQMEATRDPERIAITDGVNSLTLRSLVDHATIVARRLIAEGVQADDCIGLFADSSIAQNVGLWGILLGGGAYLPLAPEYPEERLRYMMADARVSIILCERHHHAKVAELAPSGTRILDIEDFLSPTSHDAMVIIDLPFVNPGDLAYVIYTSGSTGRPKGVMIEHRAIASQMAWLAREHGIGRGERILQKTPASFDAAQWELLAAANGATLVAGAPGIFRDPDAIIDAVRRHGITILQCVPTLLKALVEVERSHDLASLRYLFSGGEALTCDLASAWRVYAPWCALTNLYGPTECTINTSAYRVGGDECGGIISIGRPVDHLRYHIVDSDLKPVDAGKAGELLVSGVQLARGYLHQPELTAQRFPPNPFESVWPHDRVYRTGDIVRSAEDGTVHYLGRADNQLKLRGYRIELDEIGHAIEAHDWVKTAAVIVQTDQATGDQLLLAYIELSPRQAALMDQGNHGAHHQSKANRLQVRAQLSNAGIRDIQGLVDESKTIELPGKQEEPGQRALAFARKTYRFFDGAPITRRDVERLLAEWVLLANGPGPISPQNLTQDALGSILRILGPYRSEERLLPKYAYASPGALYAVQLYLEVGTGVRALPSGIYYFHPERHELLRLGDARTEGAPLTFHFTGKRAAIEPVYRNNIREVLEMEAGHMVGLLDVVLAHHGLAVGSPFHDGALLQRLDLPEDDFCLASYPVEAQSQTVPDWHVSLFLQPAGEGLPGLDPGKYRWTGSGLERLSDGHIERRHVIAINQRVYDRARFGISIVSDHPDQWRRYLDLGRCLQRLQMNDIGIGLMSSGYSSESGNPLPSDRQLKALLAHHVAVDSATYFCVGGPVSEEQRLSQGMREDAVHMQGPAELIKEDLRRILPDYMIPNQVVILDQLPQTSNGKVDRKALEALAQQEGRNSTRAAIAPRTQTEERIGAVWTEVLKQPLISVHDDFFQVGGNSLRAVVLIQRINRVFGTALPLQTLFDAPDVAALAARVDGSVKAQTSRAVCLASGGGRPVFCWPGLGGYAMNLRQLAQSGATGDRPFFGVQAHGLNAGETPDVDIEAMAARDILLIRNIQPHGPYSLWGYSFGARVAFETASQLEAAGCEVDHLFLIAPGSPTLTVGDAGGRRDFGDPAFLTILFSVFAGSIHDARLPALIGQVCDENSFVAQITKFFPDIDETLVRRITEIVRLTYSFRYSFDELSRRQIRAPITIFKATGDDYSFIEGSSGFSADPPVSIQLASDHYALLRQPGVRVLAETIEAALNRDQLVLAS